MLSPADIAQPIRTILRHQRNTEVLMDEVVAIDAAARQVALGQRRAASPTTTSSSPPAPPTPTSATIEWAPLAPGLKTIEDAIEIRRRVLLAFELAERQMLEQGWHPPLNFVVIGGGPTGVELAGAISDIAQLYMRHDFRHIDPTKSPRAAARWRAARAGRLSCGSFRQSRGHAQATRRRSPHQDAGHRRRPRLGRGQRPAHRRGSSRSGPPACRPRRSASCWARPLDKRGCVLVDDQLNPPGLPEVFVLGDLAHFEQDGHQVPGVAQPAMQMGDSRGQR